MKPQLEINHIKKFKNGNNEVLGVIYQLYAQQMAFVAYGYLRTTDDSKDVVMEVVNKLMLMNTEQRFRAPETPEAFRSWLFLITKNYCLDMIRHQKIIMSYRQNNPAKEQIEPEVDKKWSAQVVNGLLSKLPFGEQKVCTLHYEGYSHEEISSTLNISYNTVRNHLSSGKKKIRKYISQGLIVLISITIYSGL